LTATQTPTLPTPLPTSRWSISSLADDRPVPRTLLVVTALVVAALYALLWSPHYYPLSDSSLYLSVAKGLASGEGYNIIRQTHRSIRPITPLLLAGIVKCGGGIGAIHAVMILLSLVSFALMFLTVRRWLNERVAFVTTLLTSLGWWSYANAFTIMTEPAFLVCMWGSLLAFSYVSEATKQKRWALITVGAILMGAAWSNRMAATLLVPGTLFALFMSCRRVARRSEWIGWLAIFACVAGLCAFDYYRPVPKLNAEANTGGSAMGMKDVGDNDVALKGESGYRLNTMVGVTHPFVQMPVNAGRWVLETLAAGFVFPFNSTNKVIVAAGSVLALFMLLLLVVGSLRLLRSGYWWPAGLVTYFLPLWYLWGTRVKPRYMVPIAPILFVAIWVGASVVTNWVVRLIRERRGRDAGAPVYRTAGKVAVAAMLLVSVVLNGAAYGVEVYLRRFTPYDFYDQARRGAMAELVDICGYLRKNTPPDTDVWINRGASRRIIGLLCDRDVHTVRKEVGIRNPQDSKHLTRFHAFAKGPYLIALYEQDKWPQFHLPLAKPAPEGAPPRWWQLFKVDPITNELHPITVPRDRQYMNDIATPSKRS
jgi:hypothetical protein